MQVVSVNVGQPRAVEYNGKTVETGIFKEPVAGPVLVRQLNLDGDRQADLSVHGGPDMAVYVYPAEYYDFWRQELPGKELPWGMFGENLTVSGVSDTTVHIGDRFQVGGFQGIVTQPRVPCYKLGIKFGDQGMVKRVLEQGLTGFYLRVLQEGQIQAGDSVTLLEAEPQAVPVLEALRLYAAKQPDPAALRRLAAVPALAHTWQSYFLDRAARAEAEYIG